MASRITLSRPLTGAIAGVIFRHGVANVENLAPLQRRALVARGARIEDSDPQPLPEHQAKASTYIVIQFPKGEEDAVGVPLDDTFDTFDEANAIANASPELYPESDFIVAEVAVTFDVRLVPAPESAPVEPELPAVAEDDTDAQGDAPATPEQAARDAALGSEDGDVVIGQIPTDEELAAGQGAIIQQADGTIIGDGTSIPTLPADGIEREVNLSGERPGEQPEDVQAAAASENDDAQG